jgi:hypothetical protein
VRSANLQTLQRFAKAWSLAALHVACAGDDDTKLAGDAALSAECGSSFEQLEGASDVRTQYSAALASWWSPGEPCGLGVFSGVCADGKRLLYRNGGFVSEVRYYAGEQLVGLVSSGDLGFCPSLCPFSHFFGSLDDVACQAPELEELCPGSLETTPPEDLVLPFADGEAPGGCDY